MKRDCGGCTLCCKLVGVTELDKPQGKWCTHCNIGAGCKVFTKRERPKSCADFDCLWRQGIGPDELRPDKSKVVMAMTTDGEHLVLHVDPSRPNAWRAPAYQKLIDWLLGSSAKQRVYVVCGDKRTMVKNEQAS